MSMELSSNSMGGRDALPLFWDGGAELSGSSNSSWGADGFDEDEPCEELEPEWELESTSMFANRLVGGALIPVRQGDWRHATPVLVTLVVVFFTLLVAGAGFGATAPRLAARLRGH